MNLPCYRFLDFVLDPARASLRRGDVEVTLRPKSYALLERLVTHAGQVVTKSELFEALWPGVIVTEDSLTRCISEIRTALGDREQKLVKTITRRGYLFDTEVLILDPKALPTSSEAGLVTPLPSRPGDSAPGGIPRMPLALGLLGVLLLFTTWFLGSSDMPRPLSDAEPLSVLVLPFADLSPDSNRSYTADVVTSDLTLALARLRGAKVVASGSALSLKGKPADVGALAREFAVRYVVQGSVALQEERVRVSASLVNATNAAILWSDRFDVQRADLQFLHEDMVNRLASALRAELVSAEGRRTARKIGAQLDAEELAMQCEAASYVRKGEDRGVSHELCERALKIDPDNSRALVELALYYGERVERVQSPDRYEDLARAKDWVTRALRVDPNNDAAHCAQAPILAAERRMADAVAAAERCLQLNPSNVRAYRLLATQHFFLVQPEESLKYSERGMHLSPRDPQLGEFMLFKGFANLMLHKNDEALRWFRDAERAMPDYSSALAPLAATLALTGQEIEARATLARYLAAPGARARTASDWNINPAGLRAFDEFNVYLRNGLQKAGLPEQ